MCMALGIAYTMVPPPTFQYYRKRRLMCQAQGELWRAQENILSVPEILILKWSTV